MGTYTCSNTRLREVVILILQHMYITEFCIIKELIFIIIWNIYKFVANHIFFSKLLIVTDTVCV